MKCLQVVQVLKSVVLNVFDGISIYNKFSQVWGVLKCFGRDEVEFVVAQV